MFSRRKVCLRKFPYPFRAGLAICNDLDGMNPDLFRQIHEFLSSNQDTPMGKGLGLEVGDSFWFYSNDADVTGGFSYFENSGREVSQDAPLIEQGIKSGAIDCMHTYGNFSRYPGFRRQLAERALAVLRDKKLNLAVWINHGNINNMQNIGVDWALGDFGCIRAANGEFRDCSKYPDSMYHADLTFGYGFRYVWIGALTEIAGQSRPCSIFEAAFSRIDNCRSRGSLRRRLLKCIISFILVLQKKIRRVIIPEKLRRKLLPNVFDGSNDLTSIVELRDGRKVYSFTRYGRFGADTADYIPQLLSERTLDKLKGKQGYMIVFVHLARKEKNTENGLPFSPQACRALRNLARENREGGIYVTSTSRLLHYHTVSKYLRWTEEISGSELIIRIQKVSDPVSGDYVPAEGDLSGITFYVPKGLRVAVFIGSRKIKVNRNPADYTGRESVSVPLHKFRGANIFNVSQELKC